MNNPTNLTSSKFWDHWWRNVVFPVVPDPRISYDRVFMEVFDRLDLVQSDTVFEVGCAPGKWLVYFQKRFGCRVAGSEMSTQGLRALARNLECCGVTAEIVAGDFLTADLSGRQYNVVLSLGFIEHFGSPWEVLRRHVDLVKPGGLLVLEVPNFRGFNRWFQGRSLLEAHNLGVMTKAFFLNVADRFGLGLKYLDYLGGFEPAALDTRERPWVVRALASAFRRLPGVRTVRSPWWSGFLMGVFQKSIGPRPINGERRFDAL